MFEIYLGFAIPARVAASRSGIFLRNRTFSGFLKPSFLPVGREHRSRFSRATAFASLTFL